MNLLISLTAKFNSSKFFRLLSLVNFSALYQITCYIFRYKNSNKRIRGTDKLTREVKFPCNNTWNHHHHLHHHHHHHHLALQPFEDFLLLSQVSPSSSVLRLSSQFLNFSFLRSSITSPCHRCFVLPTGLFPMSFQSNSFLVGLAWSILWISPSHLILCALMNLNISAPSINLSISMLFRVLPMYCQYWQDQISSLVFAFQKCLWYFHVLLLNSKSLMST